MGILPAILPKAGRVALDVAGIVRCSIEGWRQHQGQSVIRADELAMQRRHRLRGTIRQRHARKNRPGLRDGVDPAFRIVVRTERRAVVKIRAPVPLPVPGVGVERTRKRTQMRAVGLDARGIEIGRVPIPTPDKATSAAITLDDLDAVSAILLVTVNAGDDAIEFDPDAKVWEPHGYAVTVAPL